MIIKSALLIIYTNPSKWSTFNVRLMPDKNFRMIAPTVSPVGVSTNWLKFIAHIFLIFTANLTKFYGDVALLVYQISLKLVHKNIVSTPFYCLVQRRKIRRKSNEFQGLVSQELLGLFLSNLVCKVLYMKALHYVD